MGMDYSLVQRIIDGLGKILDTKPGSPDSGTYVTEQQLADWIKGQTVVPTYYYNGVMYSDALHTTPITGQAGALYIDQDNNVLYRWDGAAWDAMSDNQLRQDILDGTVVAKKAECDEDGNNIKATYATKTEAANLQSQVDVLDHRVENLEQAKGKYVVNTYKDGAITPSGKGDWAVVEGLRACSRVENNLLSNGDFASTTDWSFSSATFSVSDNVATVTPTGSNGQIAHNYTFITGHTYLVFADIKLSSANATTRILAVSEPTVSAYAQSNTNWQQVALVCTVTSGGNGYVVARDNSSQSAFSVRNFVVTDLTLYFGGTIPSDADTIAKIQTNYPHLLTPSEYGVRIVDASYVGVMCDPAGKNFLDISQYGQIKLAEGVYRYGLMRMLPAGTYTVSGIASQSYATGFVTSAGVSDGVDVNGSFSRTFTISEAKLFAMWNSSETPAVTNLMLNTGSSALPWEAYKTDTLSLSFTGKSAGAVADTLEPNAEIVQEINGQKVTIYKKRTTERIDSVDLGTLNWIKSDNGNYFYADLPTSSVTNSLALCAKYINVSSGQAMYTGAEDKVVGVALNYISGRTDRVYIRDSAYSDATAFKTSLDGVMLYYQKATPVVTLSDPILDNTLLTEAYGRMSTVQTGTVVDGSFDLGFINL